MKRKKAVAAILAAAALASATPSWPEAYAASMSGSIRQEQQDSETSQTETDNAEAMQTENVQTRQTEQEPVQRQNNTGTESPAMFTTNRTQVDSLMILSEKQRVEVIGEMARKCYAKNGILASVTAAQCILESGCLASSLSREVNNCFGMKASLSGNNWDESTWEVGSHVNKPTWEDYGGNIVHITAYFRAYGSMEESMADYAAYIKNAMAGDRKRYEGAVGETDYRTLITLIKKGGYATDSSYVDKICSIIESYDLTRFDDISGTPVYGEELVSIPDRPDPSDYKKKDTVVMDEHNDGYYRVRKSWEDPSTQLGVYKVLENAISVCGPEYNVYNPDGTILYSGTP